MTAIKKLLTELDAKSENATGDVISQIKADHQTVDVLFTEYQKSTSSSDKRLLLHRIIQELNIHTAAEEKLVYPTLEKDDEEGTLEAFEEHHVVENILKELMNVDKLDELVDAKVEVLSELVKHHVKEEESKLLPEVKKTGVDLDELGADFKAGKEAMKMKPPKPGQANSKAKSFKRKAS